MAVDFDQLVIGPCLAVFGQPVIWQTPGRAPVTVTAVFDAAASEQSFDRDGTPVEGSRPRLGIQVSQFPWPPLQGDQATVLDPVTGAVVGVYTVGEVKPDSHGHADVPLVILL